MEIMALKDILAKGLECFAEKSASSASWTLFYEPDVPADLLKKFEEASNKENMKKVK